MNPDVSRIEKLHKKYAPSEVVLESVYNHCQIVLEIIKQLLEKKPKELNLELIKAGALLHDIGSYMFVSEDGEYDEKNYLRHGLEGYKILQKEGLAEELCLIIKNHVGVGITREQITKHNLPLPVDDYRPQTIEQKLVAYADKFHSKTPRFNSFESYANFVSKFGEENVNAFQKMADEFGLPDLEILAKKYNQPIV